MSGFYTKERNENGDYEITFYTENRQDFEKVQDLCRELIGHGKPVSDEVNCKDCDGYEAGYSAGLKDAERQGEWISVSERLPFNYVLCLFCDKEGNIFYGHRKSNNLWYEEYQNESISDVIAWQPLPEPYQKGDKEE